MSFLSDIMEVKKEEVRIMRNRNSLSFYKDSPYFDSDKLSLIDSISASNGIALISEIKKASPSKGVLRENFNHMKIAETYMSNPVAGISILTDKIFFKGDIKFLNEIASIKNVPLLRKDFIIDEHQIWDAKSNGADAILLICEVLSESQISELTHAAHECKLEVLLELHSEEQIQKIDFDLNTLIGINNRNLETFDVDIRTTLKLSEKLPDHVTIVSESGYSKKDNVEMLKSSGAKAILAGEHFMNSADINSRIKEFLEWCAYEN